MDRRAMREASRNASTICRLVAFPRRFSRMAAINAGTALAAPTWQGREGYEDGILTIFNPATPVNQPSVVKPEPQWRIGGDDDPAETLFGLITDAQRRPDGTTYLLDAVLSTVYEISPTGEVRRTLGREGDGPGEFRNSTSLALLPDRKIGIVEMMPSHMVVLDAEGLPQPGFDLTDGSGGHCTIQRLVVAGDIMVLSMFSMNFNAGKAEVRELLGTFDLTGALQHKVLHTYAEQSGGSISISSGEDNDFTNNWVLGPAGQIIVYRRTSQYLLEVFNHDGTPRHNIRRQYESVKRPAKELAAAQQQRENMRERFGTTMDVEIEEMARDIGQVIARPNGELWVLSSRGVRENPAGSIGLFDVFDDQGHFVRQFSITADYNADDDQFLIRGSHLYVLKEARNAPDRTISSGGGGGRMMMIQMSSSGGVTEDEEDEELLPFEVICYELPAGI